MALVTTSLAPALIGSGARAAYTVAYSQDGADVVASGHGTIDLGALSYLQTDSGFATAQLYPLLGIALAGPAAGNGSIDIYEGASGPRALGAGGFAAATSGSGDFAGVGGAGGFVSVPEGYVSKAALSDFSAYSGATLASLGLTPGAYVFRWGSGADADSVTVEIGSDVPASSYTVTYRQVGNDVVATGQGTINLNALTYLQTDSGFATAQLYPPLGIALAGPAAGNGSIDIYEGASGPKALGAGAFAMATSGSGDFAGVGGAGGFVSVPEGYVSGAWLSDVSTYDDATFASLGLVSGTYVYRWGAGDDAGTFTLQVGAGVPEPSTWAVVLAGFAGLGFAGRRRARFVIGAA